MKIHKITIVTNEGVRTIEVGRDNVDMIKDVSSGQEDGSITLAYAVYDNKKNKLTKIENCPVVIDYNSPTF